MKPEQIDLDKLADMMLQDMEDLKPEVSPKYIAVMYLHRAFKLGDKNGWWVEQDNKMVGK